MRQSAGLLLYRFQAGALEVLLVHPGGPFWKGKEVGAWSIPKGEFGPEEDGLAAAIRETEEETGHRFEGNFIPLQTIKQKAGKMVHAWALEADFDPAKLTSNSFPYQWPPHSGRWIQIPEVDKAAWCSLADAQQKINPAQWPFIEELQQVLSPEK
jgi:predicted NUDIX family NTP pyrophosphohydrolase